MSLYLFLIKKLLFNGLRCKKCLKAIQNHDLPSNVSYAKGRVNSNLFYQYRVIHCQVN